MVFDMASLGGQRLTAQVPTPFAVSHMLGAFDPTIDAAYLSSIMSLTGSSGIAPAGDIGALTSLDQVLHEITTDHDPKSLNDKLKNFLPKESRDVIFASSLGGGQDPLSVLDPEQNTIGYLYILAARLHAPAAQPPSLQAIEDFCSRFNPQHARFAPERVTALAKGIIRAAEESSNIKFALGPLYDLVTRYPPDLTYLTTLRPLFITACVTSRHFATALPVLSVPIINVDTSLSDLTYNDNLIYHYAGGVVLGALKMWREAEEFFEICITSPAQVPAAIQFEALKKLSLVQLILHGKTMPIPKYANAVLGRLFKHSPYWRLAEAYPKPVSELQALVSKEIEAFTRDQNAGLVHQVIERAPRWLIRKATLTYLTMGLSDIAKETGNPDQGENRALVLNMIDNGEINATISGDDTVTFSESTSKITKADVDKALKSAQEQGALLLELERTLHSSKDYLNKALKHKDDAGWGADDDVGFHVPGPGSAWAEDSMFT